MSLSASQTSFNASQTSIDKTTFKLLHYKADQVIKFQIYGVLSSLYASPKKIGRNQP